MDRRRRHHAVRLQQGGGHEAVPVRLGARRRGPLRGPVLRALDRRCGAGSQQLLRGPRRSAVVDLLPQPEPGLLGRPVTGRPGGRPRRRPDGVDGPGGQPRLRQAPEPRADDEGLTVHAAAGGAGARHPHRHRPVSWLCRNPTEGQAITCGEVVRNPVVGRGASRRPGAGCSAWPRAPHSRRPVWRPAARTAGATR
ncbi:hypothetical protein SGPA1_41105 [Streptomyces misionensis JCM 4497]